MDMDQKHPPPGESIELTCISSNGEEGKFYGTYVPGEGTHFALDPLPGKKFVQQLPMYRFQGLGWDYEKPPINDDGEVDEKEKKDIDDVQVLVDLWGVPRMKFPAGKDPGSLICTWTLTKDVKPVPVG